MNPNFCFKIELHVASFKVYTYNITPSWFSYISDLIAALYVCLTKRHDRCSICAFQSYVLCVFIAIMTQYSSLPVMAACNRYLRNVAPSTYIFSS